MSASEPFPSLPNSGGHTPSMIIDTRYHMLRSLSHWLKRLFHDNYRRDRYHGTFL